MMSRRSLFAMGAVPAAAALSRAASPRSMAASPVIPFQVMQTNPPAAAGSPFTDPDFGFTAQLSLSASYYQGGNPGRLFAILPKIAPGDFESAWKAYHDAAIEARTLAEQALAKRQPVSAREAYLWAANYFRSSLRLLDGTKDPDRMAPCWKEYAACWAGAAALFDPPAERIEIPYGNAALTGWFFHAGASARPKPLIVLNNGADGLEISLYFLGGAGALARGYNCLIFNGPGQGDSLWERKLYFRPDWENAITPVVDAMLSRPDVDPKRIALVGASQGGYWVPRALAFEHRIAAGVADPGVWDVSEPFLRNVPKIVLDMLDGDNRTTFDQMVGAGLAQDPKTAGMLRFRQRPYGLTSYFDLFRAVREYKLAGIAERIKCPMLIADPEGEQFFPGQAQRLYDALQCPKKLIHFTHDQGAGSHCEAGAPGYRDYCIYNWLAEILA
jgi:hypothetical protein